MQMEVDVDCTIHTRKEARAWQTAHDAHAPKVGNMAPDFACADPSGQHEVRLSGFRGKKPVALVFGSFT
jgi:hypothetical protein